MDKDSLNYAGLIVVLSFALFFVSTNVNPSLGNIYQGLAAVGIAMLLADYTFGRRDIKLVNKSINWATAILIAFISYIILILSSYFMSGLAKFLPLKEILTLLASSAPVYSSSASINFFIFAVIVPIIETAVIFALAIDLFSSLFNINLNKLSFKLIILGILLSLSFLLLHTNAKGLENESALLLVGVMGFITCVLVWWWKEARIAIIFHIICNVIASISIFSNFVT